jgi:hypothetical protein
MERIELLKNAVCSKGEFIMSASSNDRKSPKGAVAIPAVAAAILFAGAQKRKQSEEMSRRKQQPLSPPRCAKAA